MGKLSNDEFAAQMAETERNDPLFKAAHGALYQKLYDHGLPCSLVEDINAFIDVKLALAIEALSARALDHRGDDRG